MVVRAPAVGYFGECRVPLGDEGKACQACDGSVFACSACIVIITLTITKTCACTAKSNCGCIVNTQGD